MPNRERLRNKHLIERFGCLLKMLCAMCRYFSGSESKIMDEKVLVNELGSGRPIKVS